VEVRDTEDCIKLLSVVGDVVPDRRDAGVSRFETDKLQRLIVIA